MAPIVFHLVSLEPAVEESDFISALRKIPSTDRPLRVAKCHHWIHAPRLSTDALSGTGPNVQQWDYLIVQSGTEASSLDLSAYLTQFTGRVWSLNGKIDDAMLSNLSAAQVTRKSAPALTLPRGWSPSDHSGLDAADPPPDLEASLALSAIPMGSSRITGKSVGLKDYVRDFGSEHTGAIEMFNLLSYHPGKRSRYFEYIAAFAESVGSKYGGEGFVLATDVDTWSSQRDERAQQSDAGWEDAALVYYPSIWHFGKMLDDDGYVDADRRFKQGVLRDNPILCCTEVEI